MEKEPAMKTVSQKIEIKKFVGILYSKNYLFYQFYINFIKNDSLTAMLYYKKPILYNPNQLYYAVKKHIFKHIFLIISINFRNHVLNTMN